MLTISTVINYKSKTKQVYRWPGATKAERLKAKRDFWRAQGLCMQHGNPRPCEKCATAASNWRKRQ